MARLGDICEILNGYAFKSEKYISSGIRVIRIANVQKGYNEDTAPAFYPIDTPNIEKYTLYEDDLLISLTGNVGRVALLDKEFLPAALNQRVACLRLKEGVPYNKSFLYCFLNSDYFENKCIQSAKGVAQKNMSTEWLKDYEIPDLSLEEQREIATALNKVSELITARTQQLSTFDNIVKSRFIELFGNETISQSWPKTNIGSVALDARTGPFGSALHHDEFVDEGVFVLGIDNAVENRFSYNKMRYITEEKYQQLKRYTVKSGDVIITIMGTVGRSAVIPEDMPKAINTKHLACITPDQSQVDPYFLTCLFQMHPDIRLQLQNQCKGAIMDGLNLTIIKALKFSLPPLSLQKQFVSFFKQTDKLKFEVKEALEKLEILKKSLMQQYFG